MNKDNCEYYDYCCSHELCEECVSVQIIYGRNEYTAVGITNADFDRSEAMDIDDGDPLPF